MTLVLSYWSPSQKPYSLNLLHYPFCYLFRAPAMLMPHESTVSFSLSTVGTNRRKMALVVVVLVDDVVVVVFVVNGP